MHFDIQPVERVDMTQRVDQVRRRIAEIEEKIGISGADFQTKLEREIARQAAMNPVKPTQNISEMQTLPGANQPVNGNEIANSEKVAQALRESEIKEIQPPGKKDINPNEPSKTNVPAEQNSPEKINPQPHNPKKIERADFPDTELEIPSRDDKIFEDNYFGKDAEVIPTEDLIMQTAYEYGVDPQLVKAIAIAESDMNQNEISPVGAIGVMQLMPETAESLGVNPYDEAENIVGGTKYIRQMLDTFDGDIPLAVAAYNAGPAAVQRYGGIPPYSETKNYVGRVMDLFQ